MSMHLPSPPDDVPEPQPAVAAETTDKVTAEFAPADIPDAETLQLLIAAFAEAKRQLRGETPPELPTFREAERTENPELGKAVARAFARMDQTVEETRAQADELRKRAEQDGPDANTEEHRRGLADLLDAVRYCNENGVEADLRIDNGNETFGDDRIEQIRAAIAQLPPDEQVLLKLHHVHGLTMPEIATHLGISVAVAKGQFARAKRRLAKLMRDSAGE